MRCVGNGSAVAPSVTKAAGRDVPHDFHARGLHIDEYVNLVKFVCMKNNMYQNRRGQREHCRWAVIKVKMRSLRLLEYLTRVRLDDFLHENGFLVALLKFKQAARYFETPFEEPHSACIDGEINSVSRGVKYIARLGSSLYR